MAVLADADRVTVWAEWMRDVSNEREQVAITKQDLRAAVNAIDDFMQSNQAAINNAFPEPAKSNLTTAQKARVLMYVVRKRYIEGA